MSLPLLSNLFAARFASPDTTLRLRSALEQSGFFESVESKTIGRDSWLIARAPLHQAEPSIPVRSLEFCEGADAFDAAPSTRAEFVRELERDCPNLARFSGDFGCIHWSSSGVTLVRSCGGRVPLYYWEQSDELMLATRLDYLVAFMGQEPRLDGFATALILSSYATFPEARTNIAGVKCLPPGHLLKVQRNKPLRAQRYWFPRVRLEAPTAARREEHAEQLRTALLDCLERELDPTGGNLLWFSGGPDSSALAALSCEALQRPLWTQTFTAPDAATANFETAYVVALEERYRFQKTWRTPRTAERYLEYARSAPQTSLPTTHYALCALPEVTATAQPRLVFGGEFADEGCGSLRRLGDWLDHTSLLDVFRHGGAAPSGWAAAKHWTAWRLRNAVARQWIRLPEHLGAEIQPQIEEEFQDWASAQRRLFAADHEPLRTLHFQVSQDQWVAEMWETTTSVGARPLAPFFTRAALELFFRAHPAELFEGRTSKGLLRRAMKGHMPDWHRTRADKGPWPGYLQGARGRATILHPELATQVLNPEWLERHAQPQAGGKRLDLELNVMDALRITWFGNMLSGVIKLRTVAPSFGGAQQSDSP